MVNPYSPWALTGDNVRRIGEYSANLYPFGYNQQWDTNSGLPPFDASTRAGFESSGMSRDQANRHAMEMNTSISPWAMTGGADWRAGLIDDAFAVPNDSAAFMSNRAPANQYMDRARRLIGKESAARSVKETPRVAFTAPTIGPAPSLTKTLKDYLVDKDVKASVADQINQMNRENRRGVKSAKKDLSEELGLIRAINRESLRSSKMEVKKAQERTDALDKMVDDSRDDAAEQLKEIVESGPTFLGDGYNEHIGANKDAQERQAIIDQKLREEAMQAEKPVDRIADYVAHTEGEIEQESRKARRDTAKEVSELRARMRDNAALAPQLTRQIANDMYNQALSKYSSDLQSYATMAAQRLQAAELAMEADKYNREVAASEALANDPNAAFMKMFMADPSPWLQAWSDKYKTDMKATTGSRNISGKDKETGGPFEQEIRLVDDRVMGRSPLDIFGQFGNGGRWRR